ncbi:MAG: hydantoinase/carbamoylase family amidase [Actinomycetota bacterium]
MAQIHGERLIGDLRTLRTFGATETGVVRQTFSDIDMEARRWLQQQMVDAGLDASIDGVGNVFGRSPNPGPTLIIGSHSDTQPRGGWLDGAMGVLYGIEIARSLRENQSTAGLSVDVVSWADEESTYVSFLGSRSFVGELPDEDLSATNAGGESAAAAIERVGLGGVPRVTLEPDRHRYYFEPHIEQGPYLEERRQRIGVVTSIVGIRAASVTFVGEQNHAGTTPMNRRADAGVALFDYAVRMRERVAAAAGPTSVWTIGNATLEPGAQSIIPGRASLTVQWRDADEDTLDRMEAAIVSAADEVDGAGPVRVEVSPSRVKVPPAGMDAVLRGHLADAAAQRAPGEWAEMPSAAAHDAMILAEHLPSAMLFIPSIGGISHDFAEDSLEEDIVLGCQVMADAAESLLQSA